MKTIKKTDKIKIYSNSIRVIKNVCYLLCRTHKYAPLYIVMTLGNSLVDAFLHIFNILYLKYLFDALEIGTSFLNILIVSLLYASYCGLHALMNNWYLNVYRPKALLSLHEGIQRELYCKAKELDQSCYDDPYFYDNFVWAINEADSRAVGLVDVIGNYVNYILSCIVILGVLVSIDWIVAMILLISVIMGGGIQFCINKVHYDRSIELNNINRKLGYFDRVFYLSDYAKELRLGNISDLMMEQYSNTTKVKIECLKKYSGKILGLSLLASLFTNVLPYMGVTGYLFVRYLLDSTLSLGGFSASINATFRLYWTINDIGNVINDLNEHSLYIEKLRHFVDYKPIIKGEMTEIPEFESLTVKNLAFTYNFSEEQTSSKNALNHINLKISKGEKIAFVGYNGAGKTTLIKLLLRLYDPTEGEIFYNEQNIRTYDPMSYRRHIGVVFQDYKLFAATIAENVIGGEYTEQDEENVLRALDITLFNRKLKTLPDGVKSQLTREFNDEGVELSGGEIQKIAIARAFVRSCELIIMDEPTSALDPITEYNLNKFVLKNAVAKTIIFISHRLSTTRMADRIYMFDQGELIESGSHEELMSQNGKYAAMYRVQKEKYKT